MEKKKFTGDKKVGQSILSKPEKAFVAWGTPKIPRFLETYHLTMMTLIWSGLNVIFGYQAQKSGNLNWLWGVSGMIVLQYLTDVFDGAVGRMRNTGLVKWGFFMDHFLDYVFLSSLVLAGYFIAPARLTEWYMGLLIVVGCFMVNSFLSFAATNEFEIYHFGFGPTEMRIVFIIINTVIIYTGTRHFPYSVPALVGVCCLALAWQVYRTHRKLWKMDMEAKGGALLKKEPEKAKTEVKKETAEKKAAAEKKETAEKQSPKKTAVEKKETIEKKTSARKSTGKKRTSKKRTRKNKI